MEHELKIWPMEFQAVVQGIKTFEWRKNDRNFAVQDILNLKEWNPSGGYTGRFIKAEVTWILYAGEFDVPEGYCVMSIKVVHNG